MYRYEMHLHTAPVSKCAKASVEEALKFYQPQGYDGVFITNHLIDGQVGKDGKSYEELLEFFFSDYEEALALSEKIGIKVFSGAEVTYVQYPLAAMEPLALIIG